MAVPTDLLFVYGTLRRGSGHPMSLRLMRHSSVVGAGTVAGRLYRIGSFPGLVRDDSDGGGSPSRVPGELLRLTDPLADLEWIDEYEGCAPSDPDGSLFVREVTPIATDEGRTVDAWVYWFNRSVEGFERMDRMP
ncbi:MAG: gamma-glutamylcyclotransferase [Phycisphaerales bacterium]